MKPHQPLISTRQAEALIFENLAALTPQTLPVAEAGGRVLRQAVVAERRQPPFDRVMMDGIALGSRAVFAGRRHFRVQATLAAGQVPMPLEEATACIEVMTGAVLPPGCDAVVPVERIQVEGGHATLESGYRLRSGQHIHPAGSDYPRGKILLEPGIRIGAPEVAIIASAGMAEVTVSPRLRGGIISLGDELIAAGQPIAAHQIRRSNDIAVKAAIESRADVQCDCQPLADDREAVAGKVRAFLDSHDFLVLCGGVSKGKFDFVPRLLAGLGVRKVFHRIAQRPGKPFWFGVTANGQPVFALPGNPVSVLACTARYVLPALDRMRGLKAGQMVTRRLARAVDFKPPLSWLLAVDASGDLALPCFTNTSGDFAGLAGATGVVELPAEESYFPAAYPAAFYPWGVA